MKRKFSLTDLIAWTSYSCVLAALVSQLGFEGGVIATGPCWAVELARSESGNLLDFLAAITLTIIGLLLLITRFLVPA